MAIYRQIHVSFWQDAFVLDLTPEEKYFYLYLMTNSKTSQCGIYELPIRIIEMDTVYSRETIEKLLKRFQEYGKILYSEKTKEIMLLNWLKFNFINSPKVKSCMTKELSEIKNKEFLKKLIDVVKEQKLTEDTQWIPYENTSEKPTNEALEYPTDILSIPNENPAKPTNTISIDYGEERKEEKEREINQEEKQKREKELEIKEEEKQQREKELKKPGEIEKLSVSLLKEFESFTGHLGNINLNSIKTAVKIHGYENVKTAMEKALEANKPTMNYVNGILKNWAKDGYPKQWEGVKNGNRVNPRENNKGKFIGVKPGDPRKLTKAEQREIEGELL